MVPCFAKSPPKKAAVVQKNNCSGRPSVMPLKTIISYSEALGNGREEGGGHTIDKSVGFDKWIIRGRSQQEQ